VASNSATNELLGIERKMLEALKLGFDNWKQTGAGMPPAPLIKLMETTHAAIRERVKRQFGVDTRNMSLREQLVELKQMEQQILELLELEEQEGGADEGISG
jgi:hypothetical protein